MLRSSRLMAPRPSSRPCRSFPMATSAAFLAWGIIEFEQGYTAAGEMEHAREGLRWATDYL